MEKRYASIKEISEYTSLPIKTLYDWASCGKIPSIKCGRRVLFDLEDINRFLQSNKRTINQQCDKTVNKIVGSILESGYTK